MLLWTPAAASHGTAEIVFVCNPGQVWIKSFCGPGPCFFLRRLSWNYGSIAPSVDHWVRNSKDFWSIFSFLPYLNIPFIIFFTNSFTAMNVSSNYARTTSNNNKFPLSVRIIREFKFVTNGISNILRRKTYWSKCLRWKNVPFVTQYNMIFAKLFEISLTNFIKTLLKHYGTLLVLPKEPKILIWKIDPY